MPWHPKLRRVGPARFERRPTIRKHRDWLVGRRGDAPLVPPYFQLLVAEQFLVRLLLGFAFGLLEVDVLHVVGVFRAVLAGEQALDGQDRKSVV